MLSPIIIEDSSVVKFLNSWGFNWFSIFIFPFILLPCDEELTRMFKKKLGSSPNLITLKQVTLNRHNIRFQQNLELFWLGYVVLFLFEFLVYFWKYGRCDLAIKNIRFEQEIFQNSFEYYKTREVFGWRKFKIFPDLDNSNTPSSPEITVIESTPLVGSPNQGINFEITDTVDDDITPVEENKHEETESQVVPESEEVNKSKNQDEEPVSNESNEETNEETNEESESNEEVDEDPESNEDDEETRM